MADTINTKTLAIEPEMLDIIAELDEFKGAWCALSTLAPERLSALRRVATIESIGSSTRIEGIKLTPYGSLESVIEQSKDSDYLALRRTQKTTRSNAWSRGLNARRKSWDSFPSFPCASMS